MNRSLVLLVAATTLSLATACTSSLPQFCGLQKGMTEDQFTARSIDRQCNIDRTFTNQELGRSPIGGGSAGRWDANGQVGAATTPLAGPSVVAPTWTVSSAGSKWDIWTYHVGRTFLRKGHDEYAIFQDGQLAFWGLGLPKDVLLKNPQHASN